MKISLIRLEPTFASTTSGVDGLFDVDFDDIIVRYKEEVFIKA